VPVLFSILGLLGIPVGVYLLSLCIRAGVSAWGWAWMGLYVLFDYAALYAQSEPRRARVVGGVGLVLLLALVGARHVRSHPTAAGRTILLPSEAPGPWIDRLGDDGDLGMLLFVAMTDFGGIRGEDARRAKPYIRTAYRRLRADTDFATIPSPIPSNLLGRTSETALHTLVLNPQERAPRAVILLHGTGGSSMLPCWLLARRMPDALIVCPTVGMGGEWFNERGVRAWEHALNYATAHSEGVYAIGMGYGGRGLLHLANQNLLGHVSGFVLLSGFDENYFDQVRRSRVPVLIIRGDADARTPPFRVEGIAGLERVQNVELNAGHFVLYEQEEGVLELIDSFCGAR
jgi:pimeloyl-ACP methyl ester carboxylesterase